MQQKTSFLIHITNIDCHREKSVFQYKNLLKYKLGCLTFSFVYTINFHKFYCHILKSNDV